MSPARFQLKDDVDPEAFISGLKTLAVNGKNASSMIGLPKVRNEYLAWAESVEDTLSHHGSDPTQRAFVLSERHWRIRELQDNSPRPHAFITAEISEVCSRLEAIIAGIELQRRKLQGDGLIAVLDTNVLLHHEPISEVSWPAVVQADSIRLLIPLRVIEELDQKKWSESDKLRRRARRIVPQLARLLASRSIDDRVSLESPVLDGFDRSLDADQDILETCVEIKRYVPNEVVLVTGDLGMTLRAAALQIPTREMPAKYRRIRDELES